ncbi:hypothetical protein PCANC_10748 [Puccinia coronata f. sp. avenae]|uniref:Uncharacterized protein n=1 Tax=Puccinia coronata f. sp. avenae TaxID=200324 RepID=A0A2N5VSV7_9BASI|nr:hypothetical protein PCANC_10748 [Puccinia coronata f. sp. avenae]
MSGSSTGAGPADNKADLNYMRLLMEAQHTSILQAQQDRAALAERMSRFEEASAQRIAWLEEAILLLSTKREDPPEQSSTTATPLPLGRVDLQRFRTSDGLAYDGPFHGVEPFLKWMNAVQLFFASKGILHNTNKIRIVGSLIRKVNVLSFYSNRVEALLSLSWAQFKSEIFDFALPSLWRTTLRDQLRDFWMRDAESFSAFSTRACTIQTLVNFDGDPNVVDGKCLPLISDLELAERVLHGLPSELKALVKNHQVLFKRPFKYIEFESRTQVFFERLPKKSSTSRFLIGSSTASSLPTTGCPSRDETIWRVHSFLDFQGKCHHCKKRCRSLAGSCPSSLNRMFVEVPSSFATPPKPSNYKPPKALPPSSSGAGRPTQSPAGCAPSKVLVSAVEDDSTFLDLDAASVAAFAAIDEQLGLACEEEYVAPSLPDRIVILFNCGDLNLRGLVDIGSEINLIAEHAVNRARLVRQPLSRPTTVHLALDETSATPFLLHDFFCTTLSHSPSSSSFPDVSLRVSPIKGRYDMILGVPFLAHFNLSVSVLSCCLTFEDSPCCMFGFRCPIAMNPPVVSTCSVAVLGPHEDVSRRILKDYEDLFPVDIPAMLDDAELEGLFTDGTFPDKLQNADSWVRHIIILTDPNAVINKCQYSYPQKHLTSWCTLLDQHVNAGQLRCLSSQYTTCVNPISLVLSQR